MFTEKGFGSTWPFYWQGVMDWLSVAAYYNWKVREQIGMVEGKVPFTDKVLRELDEDVALIAWVNSGRSVELQQIPYSELQARVKALAHWNFQLGSGGNFQTDLTDWFSARSSLQKLYKAI